jgi:TPR repeat protein
MANAQFCLGILYEKGLSVKQNTVETNKWYKISEVTMDNILKEFTKDN